jgi:choice-of-anchor A domain-containing protein
LGPSSNNTPVVAVGGKIKYENSVLPHGSVVYGGVNSSGQYTQAATPGGTFSQVPSLDFAAISNGLIGLSTAYGSMTTTGSFSSLYGAGTLTGGMQPGTDVFSISTAQLGSLYALSLTGVAGSKAIINVSGMSYGSSLNFNIGNYAASDVTFNFLDATNLSLGGSDLSASVLAPLATLTQQGGIIRGSVAVNDFAGSGTQIMGAGSFEIEVIPEPQSWMMLIVGFGAVGAALRSPRRHAAL